jgi:GAF domain-containing protein
MTMLVRHACEACTQALGARGAGLSLARGEGLGEPVCAVGLGVDELEELQFTLGEGPSVDAAAGRAPVLVSDLSGADSGRRWPMFTPAALHRGVRSVISVPLRAGAIHVGVLNVYRAMPGTPTQDELADLLVYADATMLLLMGTNDGIATSRPEITGNGFDERRAEVHQAVGMISVQLGIGVEEALVRLRAHAYAEERRLAEVARDVVERRLRFSPHTSGNPTGDGPGSGKEEDR